MPNTSEIYEKLLLSFPFEKPRFEQLQAFEHLAPWIERLFVQKFKHPLFFGCDAPAGVGKSLVAISVAHAIKDLYDEEFESTPFVEDESDEEEGGKSFPKQVWVVTQNKLLQDQYLRDFEDELFDLRGLDNYRCFHDLGKTCGQSVCGRIRAKEKDIKAGKKPPQVCLFKCEYDQMKIEALKAPVLSLNVAKALNLLKNPKVQRPLLMIFDEGHEVEAALDNEVACMITQEDLNKIGLLFPRYFSDLSDIENIESGLGELLNDLKPMFKAEESTSVRDSAWLRRFKKIENIINKIEETLAAMARGIQYVSCSRDELQLKPLQVYKVFEHFFTFPVVFLSATLLSKSGFRSITGIEEKKLDWFACESPFPVSNRPIRYYWRMGSPAVNFNNLEQELPTLVARVRSILEKHPQERGIIHTHTYKIAERFYQDLYPKYGSRLIFPKTANEQKEALERHTQIPNSVLLSPSMTQGVDLKDDLCRFVVMAKVPWLPTSDPVVRARMEMDPNWYTYKAAMTVVQAPGRGVRSVTDYADTYLIDPGFQRFVNMSKQILPKWFLDSIHPKAQGPY